MYETKRIVKLDSSLQENLLEGINTLASAVKLTMGPRGKNVLIERPGQHPIVTKDGVTVAKAINLKGQFQNLGVQVIKEAAARTADEAGDGTTTSTILAQTIFAEGLKMIAAGHDTVSIRNGIDAGVKHVLNNLSQMTKVLETPEELYQVALVSANGEANTAKLISNAVQKVGRDGTVTVEDAKGFASSLTFVDGFKVDRGYLSPYFVTNQDKMIAVLEDSLVLLCNRKLESLKSLMRPLELALESEKPILIVGNEVEGDAMQGIVLNKVKGGLKVCAIKSPGFGQERVEMMQDLSIITGARVINESDDLSEFQFEDFGKCKKAIIKRTSTLFIGYGKNNEEVAKRTIQLKERLSSYDLEEDEARVIKYRLNQLAGGIAVLKVGASTEAELVERKDRVDDALNATKAALDEGILPGGGVALVRASSDLHKNKSKYGDDVYAGIRIVKLACEEPLRQIVTNAGKSPDLILEKVKSHKHTIGYDARKEKYNDMMVTGIIDPHKVVRCALENAASTASMLLSVGAAMIEENDDTLHS
jgi:chaperonin GroEL